MLIDRVDNYGVGGANILASAATDATKSFDRWLFTVAILSHCDGFDGATSRTYATTHAFHGRDASGDVDLGFPHSLAVTRTFRQRAQSACGTQVPATVADNTAERLVKCHHGLHSVGDTVFIGRMTENSRRAVLYAKAASRAAAQKVGT